MDLITDIFDTLGEATAIATALSAPVQTVHSWKTNGTIPPWRRKRLLEVPPVAGKALSEAAIEYLQSDLRRPAAPVEQVPA